MLSRLGKLDCPTLTCISLTMYSRFNATLTAQRRANLDGVYDPHTNVMQYPRIMQPTHARWELVDDAMDEAASNMKALTTSAHSDQPTTPSQSNTIFAPVRLEITRQYLVVDTVLENARYSNLGLPGPDGDCMDLGYKGISGIPDDIKDELPEDCRRALEEAIEKEKKWKTTWGSEATDSLRRPPIIDKGVIM